jgi:hypothetical protein
VKLRQISGQPGKNERTKPLPFGRYHRLLFVVTVVTTKTQVTTPRLTFKRFKKRGGVVVVVMS